MVNTKSAKKRIIISKNKNIINRIKKSIIKTYIKKLKVYINKKDKLKCIEIYRVLQSILDRFSCKGYIHINKISRYKSNLSKLINNLN